jgi:NTP pyrophosphatase (non-canonical NTP hydrolase)
MDFGELENQMLRTAKFDEPFDRALSLCALGLTGESGEIADLVKKVFYHHHEFDEAKQAQLIEEGGDWLWYVFYLLRTLGLSFEAVLRHPRYEIIVYRPIILNVAQTFTYLAVELSCKSGELASAIFEAKDKKERATHPSSRSYFIGLLVEPVAYLSILAQKLDSSLEEMCQATIEKLNKRYPNGFNTSDSIARRDKLNATNPEEGLSHAEV